MVTPLNLQIEKTLTEPDKERTLKQIIISIVNEYFILERQTGVTEVKQLTEKTQLNRRPLPEILKSLYSMNIRRILVLKINLSTLRKEN